MQILRNIKTDITPFNKEARMIQEMIHLIMKCGMQHPLMIRLELQRAGILVTDNELKDLIFSMERQGMIKFPPPEAKPENGQPVPTNDTIPIVPINNNGNDN